MIEINLLPGAGKKNRGRGTGFSLKSVVADATRKVKDPYLLTAVASVVVAALAIGGLHLSQTSRSGALAGREEVALRDSTRYAAVLKERRKAQAKRDSVVQQLDIIKSIDNDRFVWPHIMDEVSRALPPYTWLKSLSALTPVMPPIPPAEQDKDKGKKKDPTPSLEPLRFRIVGNTVDIQALTRFMKLLETSPYVQNVQLARSEMVVQDGKEVTEFQLDAEYQRPEGNSMSSLPVSLSVR